MRATFFAIAALIACQAGADPMPRGRMVEMDGYRLHFDCQGEGAPLVVLENGFEEFSFDWTLVQTRVAKFTRVCSYDRAGYAWSDSGPAPRTFAQINFELRAALAKLGEPTPIVLVGQAFGGPIARQFALTYPHDVAGIVFVEAVSEEQRFEMWKKAVLMRDGAKGNPIPPTHAELRAADALPDSPYYNPARQPKIVPPFERLAPELQALQLWAWGQRALAATEENERTWSPEYFALWHTQPTAHSLGSLPLIVLTREHATFRDLDISGAQQEFERKSNQAQLVNLSAHGQQRFVSGSEELQVEAPDTVATAIQDVVTDVRKKRVKYSKFR